MAKKEKGSKKFNSVEDAKALITEQKEIRSSAKEERKAYAKENGLSIKEDHSGDKKHGKKWKQFTDAISAADAQIENAENWVKENKPKKSGGGNRASKYEYPSDIVSADDKKKYRAKMRAEAKRTEKEETKKSSKKSKEEAEKAPKKKSKKVKETSEDRED